MSSGGRPGFRSQGRRAPVARLAEQAGTPWFVSDPKPFELRHFETPGDFHVGDRGREVRLRSAEEILLDQLRHRQSGVRHARGEAPFVVVPGEDTHQPAIDDIGLG